MILKKASGIDAFFSVVEPYQGVLLKKTGPLCHIRYGFALLFQFFPDAVVLCLELRTGIEADGLRKASSTGFTILMASASSNKFVLESNECVKRAKSVLDENFKDP